MSEIDRCDQTQWYNEVGHQNTYYTP